MYPCSCTGPFLKTTPSEKYQQSQVSLLVQCPFLNSKPSGLSGFPDGLMPFPVPFVDPRRGEGPLFFETSLLPLFPGRAVPLDPLRSSTISSSSSSCSLFFAFGGSCHKLMCLFRALDHELRHVSLMSSGPSSEPPFSVAWCSVRFGLLNSALHVRRK